VQSWSATLYREPAQLPAIPAGAYSGADVGSITFSVPPGGKTLANVSVGTYLNCQPTGAMDGTLTIPSVPVRSNGFFTATTTQSGVISGSTAKITYTISGYFEGPNQYARAVFAGFYREDAVFASGTTTMCTSNDVSWDASLRA
jgi:hypothetical protein